MSFTKEEFKKRLLTLRKDKNATQQNVAEVIGISDKTYSKWETGENEPDLTSLSKLADYFGVAPSYLLGDETKNTTEENIKREFEGLSAEDKIDKAFECQFYAIKTLASSWFRDSTAFEQLNNKESRIPENRTAPDYAKDAGFMTAFALNDVYSMMYNGSDANIALTIMPAKDRYSWLTTKQSEIAKYLTLLGDEDMLRCLPFMLSSGQEGYYTADFIASQTGISPEKAAQLLDSCCDFTICDKVTAHIGKETVETYTTIVNDTLTGILTLTYLLLPDTQINGHTCINAPARLVISKETEKKEEK